MKNSEKPPLIEDYGLIGNLNTTALVSKQGSIDFLPYSRFDSPTIFGALLDREKGGFFSIEVKCEAVNHKQLYLPDTAVLLTRYLTNVGIAELTDFMPLEEEENQFILVRKLKVIKGDLTIRVELSPRFEYGKYGFNVEREDDHLVMRSEGPEANTCHLLCDVDFKMEDASLTTEICLKAGDEINFA
ncbi:MAG TPA: DUF5911 domain-containing protein, partial [Nitrosomonas sp.]|nr:DUF5911 domain-containing protein [Nitrosomonas sp.]